MPIRPLLAVAMLVAVAASPAATAQTDPVEHVAEDAEAHARWAADDPEGFAENHTTDPHRDPVDHAAYVGCWTADEAGAGSEAGEVCEEHRDRADESPPAEGDEGDEAGGDGAGPDPAGAGELAEAAADFVGDVREDPGEAHWHAVDLVRDGVSWVRERLEGVGAAAGQGLAIPAAGVSSAAEAVGEAGSVGLAAAVDGVQAGGDRVVGAAGALEDGVRGAAGSLESAVATAESHLQDALRSLGPADDEGGSGASAVPSGPEAEGVREPGPVDLPVPTGG